jgi:hypothetical protein
MGMRFIKSTSKYSGPLNRQENVILDLGGYLSRNISSHYWTSIVIGYKDFKYLQSMKSKKGRASR